MEEPRSLRADVPTYLLTAVLPAAAVVLFVISIISFITGYACGRCHGRKITKGMYHSKPNHPRQVPLYDDVLPNAEPHQEQVLKLKENVAYLPSNFMVTKDQ